MRELARARIVPVPMNLGESPTRTTSRRASAIGIATLAVVMSGLVWRVARYAANWPLWGDEAFLSVSLATRGFAGLSRPLAYCQIAPVGFLWAERAVIAILGRGEQALRLLPFLAGIASPLLFWRFAATNLSRRAGLLAVAFFAASFYPVRHAAEVKPYATDLLLSLALTCLARRTWSRPDDARNWMALTATSAIGVWASYPLIFVACGVGLVLASKVLSERSKRGVLLWAGLMGTTLASWSVMYLTFARPQALDAPFYPDMATWEGSFPPVLRPWELPWWFIKAHTGNMMAYPYGGNHFGSIATTLLVMCGILVLWRKDRALLGLLTAPLVPAFVAAALHRYPYGTSARISLYLAPAICILAGQGLAALLLTYLSRRFARRALLIATAGLGLTAIAGATVSVMMPYKHSTDLAYRRIARKLAEQAHPVDVWAVFNGVDERQRDKELMLMPWLAHAAQFHYYVLIEAPCPVAWLPDPREVPCATRGRTVLLFHIMDYDGLPPPHYATQLRDLTLRLGRPSVERFEAIDVEHVLAAVFPAPSR
jgi:Dolichyl-phosphate-mannose-protein mannosyltransferase